MSASRCEPRKDAESERNLRGRFNINNLSLTGLHKPRIQSRGATDTRFPTLNPYITMSIISDSAISCPACHREWQDHPGAAHCCKLATDLAANLRAILTYAKPPEYTRDIGEQEIFYDLMENARRLIVKARTFESEL